MARPVIEVEGKNGTVQEQPQSIHLVLFFFPLFF